jgi:hypothetical protein
VPAGFILTPKTWSFGPGQRISALPHINLAQVSGVRFQVSANTEAETITTGLVTAEGQ